MTSSASVVGGTTLPWFETDGEGLSLLTESPFNFFLGSQTCTDTPTAYDGAGRLVRAHQECLLNYVTGSPLLAYSPVDGVTLATDILSQGAVFGLRSYFTATDVAYFYTNADDLPDYSIESSRQILNTANSTFGVDPISISVVPEGPSVPLVAIGLLSLGLVRRFRALGNERNQEQDQTPGGPVL
jgi:hypothetical protein